MLYGRHVYLCFAPQDFKYRDSSLASAVEAARHQAFYPAVQNLPAAVYLPLRDALHESRRGQNGSGKANRGL